MILQCVCECVCGEPFGIYTKGFQTEVNMARERSGSIVTRKDKSIWARVTYIGDDGKRHDLQRRAETRTDARKIIKQLLNELENTGERALKADRLTFKELARLYQERRLIPARYVGERKVAGVRSLQPALAALRALTAYFSNRRVKSITHSDIEGYKLARLDTRTARGERSIATVNRELELMRAIFRFAYQEGWIQRSPFEKGASLISKADETKRERVLSHNEEARLLAACTERRSHLRPLLIVALDTGMRRGELFKLKWSDVDLYTAMIYVRATTTKTMTARSVGMTPRVKDELNTLWRKSPKDVSGLVFGITDTVKTGFASACRAADITGFRFHDARHTAITRMVAAGMPPAEIMKISGHTQMTTFARYVNPTADAARKGADLLAAFNASYESVAPSVTELVN